MGKPGAVAIQDAPRRPNSHEAVICASIFDAILKAFSVDMMNARSLPRGDFQAKRTAIDTSQSTSPESCALMRIVNAGLVEWTT